MTSFNWNNGYYNPVASQLTVNNCSFSNFYFLLNTASDIELTRTNGLLANAPNSVLRNIGSVVDIYNGFSSALNYGPSGLVNIGYNNFSAMLSPYMDCNAINRWVG